MCEDNTDKIMHVERIKGNYRMQLRDDTLNKNYRQTTDTIPQEFLALTEHKMPVEEKAGQE